MLFKKNIFFSYSVGITVLDPQTFKDYIIKNYVGERRLPTSRICQRGVNIGAEKKTWLTKDHENVTATAVMIDGRSGTCNFLGPTGDQQVRLPDGPRPNARRISIRSGYYSTSAKQSRSRRHARSSVNTVQ